MVFWFEELAAALEISVFEGKTPFVETENEVLGPGDRFHSEKRKFGTEGSLCHLIRENFEPKPDFFIAEILGSKQKLFFPVWKFKVWSKKVFFHFGNLNREAGRSFFQSVRENFGRKTPFYIEDFCASELKIFTTLEMYGTQPETLFFFEA